MIVSFYSMIRTNRTKACRRKLFYCGSQTWHSLIYPCTMDPVRLSDLLIPAFATLRTKLWCNLFNMDIICIHTVFQTLYQSQQMHDMIIYIPIGLVTTAIGVGIGLVLFPKYKHWFLPPRCLNSSNVVFLSGVDQKSSC